MFYITGDTHADFRRFNKENFPEQVDMTKDDYVIICGDFGGVWSKEEDKNERYWLDWLENRPFTALFVDGNHENFDRLYSMPVEEWNGGKIHRLRPSVIHLMRGQVFNIDGVSFFTFGGARSHDIQGGILDRTRPTFKEEKAYAYAWGLPYRINHESWWKEEMPSDAEMEEGLSNLAKHGNKVDFILTHDAPTHIIKLIDKNFDLDKLNTYLDDIMTNVEFKHWIFGHHHINQNISPKFICLYEQISELKVQREPVKNYEEIFKEM